MKGSGRRMSHPAVASDWGRPVLGRRTMRIPINCRRKPVKAQAERDLRGSEARSRSVSGDSGRLVPDAAPQTGQVKDVSPGTASTVAPQAGQVNVLSGSMFPPASWSMLPPAVPFPFPGRKPGGTMGQSRACWLTCYLKPQAMFKASRRASLPAAPRSAPSVAGSR
jgi:hypothetical protein